MSDDYSPAQVYELSEYIIRVLTDTHKDIKHIYIHAHQPDSNESMFRKLLSMNLPSDTTLYALDSPPGMSGYLGYLHTCYRMSKLGLPIVKIPFSDSIDIVHTRNESQAAIDYFISQGINEFAICSPPFHIARAFLAFISIINDQMCTAMKVYAIPSDPIEWTQKITHSQGLLTGKRCDLIAGEILRIKKYQSLGNLITIKQALSYMNNR